MVQAPSLVTTETGPGESLHGGGLGEGRVEEAASSWASCILLSNSHHYHTHIAPGRPRPQPAPAVGVILGPCDALIHGPRGHWHTPAWVDTAHRRWEKRGAVHELG